VGQRPALESCAVGSWGFVFGNKKSAGPEAVAMSAAQQAVGILATGNGGVVAVTEAGFGQALGGTSTSESASHITNRSSSFRASRSTGRG